MEELLPKCIVCKEENCSFLRGKKEYSKFCGRTCARKFNMLKNQKNSNSEESREKRKATLLVKYGVENIFQTDRVKNTIKDKNDDIQKKRKQTNLEKYGVIYPSQNEAIKEKVKKTNLEKYGVVSFLSIQEVRNLGKEKLYSSESKEKRKQTNFERYGVYYPIQSKKVFYNRYFGEMGKYSNIIIPLFTEKEYVGCHRRNLYTFKCLKCLLVFDDHLADGHIPRCLKCYPTYNNKPRFESYLNDWFLSLQIRFFRDDRKQISPLEIDFFFPDLNIGIEFNELQSHGERSNNKNKKYHLNKTEQCVNKNIQLIHIFQDEWFFKQKIVKSIILSKLCLQNNKIFARKCIVKEITREEANKFFNKNHLQGFLKNVKTENFGLLYENDLVMAVSFCKPRYNKSYDYELIRSCSKLNTTVIGGFEKLMKNIPLKGSIISYVDRRYFNGNSYKYWNYEGKTSPNYFYMDKKYQQRYSRLKFQKHKLSNKKENLSEWGIMQLAGYDRIWDCGNLVYSRNL